MGISKYSLGILEGRQEEKVCVNSIVAPYGWHP